MELYYSLILLLVLLFNQSNAITHQPSCHAEEGTALLQFKQSFLIDPSASGRPGAYPKVKSWKQPREGENNSSCCAWDGVECDEKTGHVIGLDLRSSCLYGSINSSSSLFRLVHLQRLNLADNHFNYSQIPNTIRNFPRLTHLILSESVFSGQVPFEISQLSKLSFLRISNNLDPSSREGLLRLDGSNFRRLVQNLTRLEHLSLRSIKISSTIPDSMANFSLLTNLDLHQCGELFGDFPVRIFKLQNLKSLYLRENRNLIGYLPEFNQSSTLTTLDLHDTRFFGDLASSIEKLGSLEQLDLGASNFSGSLLPSALGNLRQLTYLDLSLIRWGGPIPDSYANLTKLTVLRILGCSLTGKIPSWLGNFSKLSYLDLAYNSLNGSIPVSFSNLTNLKILYLHKAELSGRVDFKIFEKLQNLEELQLSDNNLEFISDSSIVNSSQIPQLTLLYLSSCNMREFPYLLRYQTRLERLDFSRNKIEGKIPKWIYNISTETLKFLTLESNHLSGFEQLPTVLPWVNLQSLSLAFNVFSGPLPVPAASTLVYQVRGNSFTGEVPPLFCNMSHLQALFFTDNNLDGMIPHCFESLNSVQAIDLSNNKLSGTIPQFFGNFTDHLQVLLLGNNSFHGPLPQTFSNISKLKMLDVSYNQLQGELPRSLANCLMLETLILSNNNFNDVFPFWLQTLPRLKILAMRRNGFQGELRKADNNQQFPNLRILDISYNNFTGEFPAKYIFSEQAMRLKATLDQSTYMDDTGIRYGTGSNDWLYIGFTFTITSKGVDRYYSKIQKALAVIDISSNNFEGKIDDWIGNLKELRSLNASNNLLTGKISSSFGNLTELESLDLSNNKLSGEIPQQLAKLTFLSQFDVSHNDITGRIPQGPQLSGFNVTSYEGNPGLCGDPLPKKCGPDAPAQPPPSSEEESDSGSGFELDWIFVWAGFGSGLVVGVVLADMEINRKRELFHEIVGKLMRCICC